MWKEKLKNKIKKGEIMKEIKIGDTIKYTKKSDIFAKTYLEKVFFYGKDEIIFEGKEKEKKNFNMMDIQILENISLEDEVKGAK